MSKADSQKAGCSKHELAKIRRPVVYVFHLAYDVMTKNFGRFAGLVILELLEPPCDRVVLNIE